MNRRNDDRVYFILFPDGLVREVGQRESLLYTFTRWLVRDVVE